MKKSLLAIVTALISTATYSQQFETHLSLSPAMTFTNDASSESRIDFGISGSIQEYYNVSSYLAIGTGLEYSFEKYSLTGDYEGSSIPEVFSSCEGTFSTHTLRVPFLIRLKSESDWMLNLGYGAAFNLAYSGATEVVSVNMNSQEENRTEIPSTTAVENDLNGYITLGIAKAFTINNARFTAELFYNYGFAEYSILHNGTNNERQYTYTTNPQFAGVKLSYSL